MYSCYGVYLIPPPPLLYALSVAHHVLATELSARTAGAFMVHCTIKGFFKLADGASPADLVPGLDALFARARPFTTEIFPPWVSSGGARGESILLWMRRCEELDRLHADVWDVVTPYVAPDCPFTPLEPAGPSFAPHITLVQSDLPAEAGLLAQAEGLSRHIFDSLPTRELVVRDLQLVEFHSEDWAGRWWETLRYRQLKGWTLADD